MADNSADFHLLPKPALSKIPINFRLILVCLMAASVGLSMVFISVSKLLLLVGGLFILLFMKQSAASTHALREMRTPLAIAIAFAAFACSLFWTLAPLSDALGSLVKYGKLIVVVLIVVFITDRREALCAMGAFVSAQAFLLTSSWMLFAGLPVPWATSRMAVEEYAVFSSYLDQGIMSAVFAAICWHLRSFVPGRLGPQAAVLLAVAAAGNVAFALSGRSAHVILIALVSVAIMWELPKKYRLVIVLLPFMLAAALFLSSTKVRDRLTLVQTEVATYSEAGKALTSSGIRLNLWNKALQAIEAAPVIGSGVGSWSTRFNSLERAAQPSHIDIAGNGNPHQEYLLWGVQLGIPGIVLLIFLLSAMGRDTLGMKTPCARAAQSTVLALAIACLFNSSVYDAQIGDFFCTLIGLLLALGWQETTDPSTASTPNKQPV